MFKKSTAQAAALIAQFQAAATITPSKTPLGLGAHLELSKIAKPRFHPQRFWNRDLT
jgi:hypothetical protein